MSSHQRIVLLDTTFIYWLSRTVTSKGMQNSSNTFSSRGFSTTQEFLHKLFMPCCHPSAQDPLAIPYALAIERFCPRETCADDNPDNFEVVGHCILNSMHYLGRIHMNILMRANIFWTCSILLFSRYGLMFLHAMTRLDEVEAETFHLSPGKASAPDEREAEVQRHQG